MCVESPARRLRQRRRISADKRQNAFSIVRVYGYPGNYPAGYGYAGYGAPRPPALIPNGAARRVYGGGLE